LHRLEGECEVTDDWMMEALDAGVVEPDVVGGPAGAEGLALRRQLADEIREATVVRVAPGFGAQDRDGVGRNLLPVGVEVGRARVEEDEARRVRRPVRAVEMLEVPDGYRAMNEREALEVMIEF
jgi:hypothetical protein